MHQLFKNVGLTYPYPRLPGSPDTYIVRNSVYFGSDFSLPYVHLIAVYIMDTNFCPLVQITSDGLWSQNESQYDAIDVPIKETQPEDLKVEDGDGLTILAAKFWLNWIGSGTKSGKLGFKFWKTDNEILEPLPEISSSGESSKPAVNDAVPKINKEESRFRFPLSAKESFKAVINRICRKWYGRLSFCWRHAKRILGGLWVSNLAEGSVFFFAVYI